MGRTKTADEAFFQAIVEERAYQLNRDGIIPIGSGTPTHIMYLIESNTTALALNHVFAVSLSGDVNIEIWANPTIGTPFSALAPSTDMLTNKVVGATRSQISTVTTSTNIADVTDFGVLVDNEILTESATGAEGKFHSQTVGDDHPNIILPGNSYLFKLTNVGAASTIRLHLEFSEEVI